MFVCYRWVFIIYLIVWNDYLFFNLVKLLLSIFFKVVVEFCIFLSLLVESGDLMICFKLVLLIIVGVLI